jgi:hypothetical protein
MSHEWTLMNTNEGGMVAVVAGGCESGKVGGDFGRTHIRGVAGLGMDGGRLNRRERR